MTLVDTHCHLNAPVFSQRWSTLVQEAKAVGVSRLIVVGWNEESSKEAIRLAQLESSIQAVIGLHPVDVHQQDNLEWLKKLYSAHQEVVVAIGEIGLDYYWKKTPEEHALQAQYFIEQITIANELHLPIVVHCRDAYEDTLKLLKAHPVKKGGVMHCYGGPSLLVPEFIQLGFYLSFGGPITFKKADEARQSALLTPLNRLLIETDSPYLSPDPYRGKENQPKNLPLIFEALTKIRKESSDILKKSLQENTLSIFHVKTK